LRAESSIFCLRNWRLAKPIDQTGPTHGFQPGVMAAIASDDGEESGKIPENAV
jgi:hypothetical protein